MQYLHMHLTIQWYFSSWIDYLTLTFKESFSSLTEWCQILSCLWQSRPTGTAGLLDSGLIRISLIRVTMMRNKFFFVFFVFSIGNFKILNERILGHEHYKFWFEALSFTYLLGSRHIFKKHYSRFSLKFLAIFLHKKLKKTQHLEVCEISLKHTRHKYPPEIEYNPLLRAKKKITFWKLFRSNGRM